MPYLNIIKALNNANRSHLVPLLLEKEKKCIGWTWQDNLKHLFRWQMPIRWEDSTNRLYLNLSHPESNQQIARAAQQMLQENYIEGWRDELLAIQENFSAQKPLGLIERSAACVLGIKTYGVHLNGLTYKNHTLHMWLARRSLQKPVEPGKLDQIVAGGIPSGLTVQENLHKESLEEANIPKIVADKAQAVGFISYHEQLRYGVRNDTIFNYDLYLPSDFVPHNNDGEVMEFICLPIADIAQQLLENPNDFKKNAAVVLIDFFIRHGILTPDSPNYEQVCHLLRVDFSYSIQ